jgi:hypothetical protein
MEEDEFLPCYHDNRLRQLAAWLLYPAPDDDKPEAADCLAWLIEQPADRVFPAVMFRVINLPVYGRDSWFLMGWREQSPPLARLIEPLHDCQLEADTVVALIGGAVVRLEARLLGDLWDIGVV